MLSQISKLLLLGGLLVTLSLVGPTPAKAQGKGGRLGAGYQGGTSVPASTPAYTPTQGQQQAGGGLRQEDRIRQRLRDGSCLTSPTVLPPGRNR